MKICIISSKLTFCVISASTVQCLHKKILQRNYFPTPEMQMDESGL